jgi:hypothetical protein
MKKQIEEKTKSSAFDINKQRMINELEYIDMKIKLMNKMASEMDNDYLKYNKIVNQIQDLNKQRKLIELQKANQDRKDELEKSKINKENRTKSKLKFYQHSQAEEKISDLKRELSKTKNISNNSKIPSPVQKDLHITEICIDEDDLSDMKEEEETRLVKKIMNETKSSRVNKTLNETQISVTSILKDVFDDKELTIENDEDLDSNKIDRILEASFTKTPPVKPKTKFFLKTIPINKKNSLEINNKILKEKSPQRAGVFSSSKSPNRQQYIIKESSTVRKDKELSEKREHLQEKFIHQREQDAKKLIEEILIENYEIEAVLNKSSSNLMTKDTKKPVSKTTINNRTKSNSPVKNQTIQNKRKQPMSKMHKNIPTINLTGKNLKNDKENTQKLKLETAEMIKENKTPSLMAKTIIELNRKESMKQAEAERILKQLEQRARLVAAAGQNSTALINNTSNNPLVQIIKPFTSYVKLQDPSKLRPDIENKPLTYTEQLMMHQEKTVELEPDSTELFKMYGSQHVPGVYKNYVKQSPRSKKTYTQRLKEMVPAESQAIFLAPSPSAQTIQIKKSFDSTKKKTVKNYSQHLKELQQNKYTVLVSARPRAQQGKHNLQTKSRVDAITKVGKNLNQQRRFTPYKKKLGESLEADHVEELSSWSLDDQMKDILYGKDSKFCKSKSKFKHIGREFDQDTLADMDGDFLMDELLADEKENEKLYDNICKDLSNLERNEKKIKITSSIPFHSQNYDENDDDYVNQVNLSDLKNLSLSSESALSSFIDWDQIDNLINKF